MIGRSHRPDKGLLSLLSQPSVHDIVIYSLTMRDLDPKIGIHWLVEQEYRGHMRKLLSCQSSLEPWMHLLACRNSDLISYVWKLRIENPLCPPRRNRGMTVCIPEGWANQAKYRHNLVTRISTNLWLVRTNTPVNNGTLWNLVKRTNFALQRFLERFLHALIALCCP